jgi:hypothetical protein
MLPYSVILKMTWQQQQQQDQQRQQQQQRQQGSKADNLKPT